VTLGSLGHFKVIHFNSGGFQTRQDAPRGVFANLQVVGNVQVIHFRRTLSGEYLFIFETNNGLYTLRGNRDERSILQLLARRTNVEMREINHGLFVLGIFAMFFLSALAIFLLLLMSTKKPSAVNQPNTNYPMYRTSNSFCRKCGKQIVEFNFCPSCGTKKQ